MKMKKYVFSSMLLGGLLMASCSDDVFEAPVQEEVQNDYSKNFVEKFGKIDPSQDWTAAKVHEVKVNTTAFSRSTGEGNEVVIYGNYDRNGGKDYKVVGVFENVTDQTTFKVTAPEYVKDFVATVNDVVASINGIVTSRTYLDCTEGAYWNEIVDDGKPVYKEFGRSVLEDYFSKVPEQKDNRKNVELATNFMFYRTETQTTKEKLRVYPIYWNAAYSHKFGIYWYNENGEMETNLIYQNKAGKDVLINTATARGIQPKAGQNDMLYGYTKTYTSLSSHGFEVTVPANKLFGFYIEVYQNSTSLNANKPDYVWYTDDSLNPDGEVHTGFYKAANGIQFIGFEDEWTEWKKKGVSRCGDSHGHGNTIFGNRHNKDRYHNGKEWPGGNYNCGSYFDKWWEQNKDNNYCNKDNDKTHSDGKKPHKRPGKGPHWPSCGPTPDYPKDKYEWSSDRDLNDFVFIIESEIETLQFEPNEWILAIEDLGSTGDYDFNDVVIRVNHVSGSPSATVTPLAAGGTLETYLYQDDNLVSKLEFHQLLGAEAGTYPMINTITAGAKGDEIIIDVDPETFTMALLTQENVPVSMGNFSIRVIGNDAQTDAREITAPSKKGAVPQMICIPADWAWPTEYTSIEEAYEGFAQWVAQPEYFDWVNAYDPNKVITNKTE